MPIAFVNIELTISRKISAAGRFYAIIYATLLLLLVYC